MQETLTVSIATAQAGSRLDKVMAESLPDISRSRLKALIKEGSVKLQEGKITTNPAGKVKADEIYVIEMPEPDDAEPLAEDIPLKVIFEDEHLIIVDKPVGMVVHPAPGSQTGTLVNALLHHCKGSLSGIGGVRRPGIVHRIDKDTSGLIVMAKHDKAHNGLSEQFADHSIKRLYTAICRGEPEDSAGRITGNLNRSSSDRLKMAVVDSGGKWAATNYRAVKYLQSGSKTIATQLECKLETGRTHQIRVHMAHIGHPLVGDQIYGNANTIPSMAAKIIKDSVSSFKRQALHARLLGFIHPITGEALTFESDPPHDMQYLLKIFDKYGEVYDANTESFDV